MRLKLILIVIFCTRTTRPREREEMANVMANKMIDPDIAEIIDVPKFGKSSNHITTYWNSEFSDGTPLGIITSNYGKDPVYNRIVDDHLNLLFIK